MAVDDELTMRVIGRYQNQNIVNTLHYRVQAQSSSDLEILENFTDLWETELDAGWALVHSDAYTLIGLKAFGKTGTAKTPSAASIGTSGGVVGDGAPAFVCRTITLYTADDKHRRHGRLMLSGTPVTHLEAQDGSLTAAATALLDTFGDLLLPGFAGGGDEFVPGIPATLTDPWQDFTAHHPRETPSSITSRRVREFLIG
ncbi:MAG: hypothetical protein KAR39_13190 [Thermoplasmata archaeon]|nr:hypothetical protein [Thermoplasmata archaeon]